MPEDPTVLSRRDVQRHERWLTALLAGLVTPSEVDDVLQGTWLAAMERPPKQPGATRAWLKTVARNLAIDGWQSRRRRRRSERRAARDEAVPSTDETVDRLATFEMLLGVVRKLPEPSRTAVLLRHYHGLSVREVAARLGVSEAAARQRVKRGLDDVRRRLAERQGSAWRERLFAVLAFGIPRQGSLPGSVIGAKAVSATALGVMLMNAKTILFGAAGVLAGGFVLISLLQSPPTPAAEPARAVPEERPAAATADGPPAVDRIAVTAAESADAAPGTWSGSVVDVRGRPVPGVVVLDAVGERMAETDAEGAFDCERNGQDDLPRLEPRVHTVRRHVQDPGQDRAQQLIFVVAPSVRAAGGVATRSGEPLEGVNITVEMRALLDFPAPLEKTRPLGVRDRETGSDGAFAFDSLAGGVSRLRFEKPGYATAVYDVDERSDPAISIALDQAEGGIWLLTGQVLDAAGWAVADAIVGLGSVRVRTDEYGRYELPSNRDDLEDSGRALYAGKPGYRTHVEDPPQIEDFDAARRLARNLTLPGPALTIGGTVRGPDGAPAAGSVVALWRTERMTGAGFAEDLAVAADIEPQRFGIAPRRVYAVTGESGAFTLGGLLDREYVLRVLHPDHLAMTSPPLRAGAAGVDLRYPADNFRPVRCRVVNTAGEPMPGLRIDTSMQVHETSGTSSWDMVDDLHTDHDGTIVLPRVLRSEATQVRVRSEDIITATEMITPDSAEPFEVVVERRCHFRIESADPRWANARFGLETAAGEMTWISSTRGTYNAEFQLVDGRSPVLTASELAVTLVVGETERVPIVLVPGEVVIVQF